MKVICLLIAAAPLFAQTLQFGVKAGIPVTDFFDTATSGQISYSSLTRRYTVGPTAELRLPFGLGIEVDALYKRFEYEHTEDGATSGARGNFWEFPLLLKVRAPGALARPYLAGGFSFRTIQGLTEFGVDLLPGGDPPELRDNSTRGVVVAGGLEIRAPFVRISPEARYTRWGSRAFDSNNGLLESNRNQFEFLVGITF